MFKITDAVPQIGILLSYDVLVVYKAVMQNIMVL